MVSLTSVTASGFKSLDRFMITLEPSLTVLLGMNGAGKSSILQLLSFMSYMAAGKPDAFLKDRDWNGKELRFLGGTRRRGRVDLIVRFDTEFGRVRWRTDWDPVSGLLMGETLRKVDKQKHPHSPILHFSQSSGGYVGEQDLPALDFKGSLLTSVQGRGSTDEDNEILKQISAWLLNIQSLELLSPAAMKGGTRLSGRDMGVRGDRLAGFLASLTNDQKSRVVSRVARFYPLDQMDTVRKRAGWIDLQLQESYRSIGTISSTQMSDGFMRLLALCAIPELPDANLVLLDEIEDGIEPHILRPLIELVETETKAQIITTTHSPVVANGLGFENLRFITRDQQGRTLAVKVSDLPSFKVGREYLGPGELWTNTQLEVLQSEAINHSIMSVHPEPEL